MTIENTLPTKSSVDDNDFVRGVSEEGESVQVSNSALKTYIGEGTATPYIDVVNVGDDKGLIFTEQVSVGSPSAPKESVFGSGDSYGVGLEDTTPDGTPAAGSAWHCDVVNTTDLTITGATDVTTILSSDSGSTTDLFNGTTVGKYLLLGSDYPFGGYKVKVTGAGDIDGSDVLMEYLWNATPTWESPASFMCARADFPHLQRANSIANNVENQQWRLGVNPIAFPTAWDKVTLNINGTDYTKHWARIRLTDTITGDATVEQVKLHTDRFEINSDGNTEYFGRSRYTRDLISGINLKVDNADKTPAYEHVKIASGVTMAVDKNEFVKNQEDGFIIPIHIVEGLDTSIPLKVVISGYPLTDTAGTIKLGIDYVNIDENFVYDGTASSEHLEATDTFPINTKEKRRNAQFAVPIDTLVPDEQVIISLYRMGNDSADDYNGNIVIADVRVVGTFWR